MKRVALVSLALVILYLYSFFLIAGIGYALAHPIPAWWGSIFFARGPAALTWMALCHTVAVLLVSLPFAFVIQRLYGRYGLVVGLSMTVSLFLYFSLPVFLDPTLSVFVNSPTGFKVVAVFDQIKLIGVLPILVWAFSRLPSNQRLERP